LNSFFKFFITVFFSCFIFYNAAGQIIDSLPDNSALDTIKINVFDTLSYNRIDSLIIVNTDTIGKAAPKDSAIYFSPRKAMLYSALAPGLGQVYNKKYWKVPIIYAGFGVTTYFLLDNVKNIKYYKKQYIADIDADPLTINTSEISTSNLLRVVNQYKRWRDMTYISYGLIYILNVIDASVDAHLKEFDISEDITLNIQPYTILSTQTNIGLTLTLKL
jgi:Family of unknown function (DUF5683)